MTSARWSMPRRTGSCSTPLPGWRKRSRRWRRCGRRGAPPITALDAHRASMERAAREADYLRHAADELKTLKPKDGEETALAGRRTIMMQGEKIASDLREAQEAVGGPHSPVPALAAAVRRLERRAANSPALVEPAVKAIDIAINALEEADQHLSAALVAADFDPGRAGAHRGAAVCAARRLAQIFDAGRWAGGARRQIRRRRRADRCRRGSVEEAGSHRCRGRPALWRGGDEAVCGPQQVRREAQQGGQRRTGAAEARAREIHDAGRNRRERRRGRKASTASSSGCRPIPAPRRAR